MLHDFLFSDSLWIGEGKITFSASSDHIHFYTRWTPHPTKEPSTHEWIQEVEMQGTDEKVANRFIITSLSETSFSLSLENDVIGKALGKGVIDQAKIAWEIKNPEIFHGFEVYELQDNGDYSLHAEYVAQDNFRTLIDGRIWKKSTQ
jgi:hypothetical protein